MISKFARSAGVASESLHDHASGTLMMRPSTRKAVMASPVTFMSQMRASALTAVLMPCLHDEIIMLFYQSPDRIQLAGRKTVIRREFDWIEPELARLPLVTCMNRKVRRNPRPLGRGQGARMQITKYLRGRRIPAFQGGVLQRGSVRCSRNCRRKADTDRECAGLSAFTGLSQTAAGITKPS